QWSYKVLYILALPPAAVIDLGRVVDIVDSSFFLMAIPNVIALFLCAGELRRDVGEYWQKVRTGSSVPERMV
ncbi:MAG: alanine glycine permease, partial [Hyphomicrobiales bacterium]